MRIVRILGGLGNQMWQYAFLIALRERYPQEDVYYDASFFNGYPLHNGFELDRIFNIKARQASKREIRKVYHFFIGKYTYSRLYRHFFPMLKTEIREVEVAPYNVSLLKTKGDFYYDGYWADHRYYDDSLKSVVSEFTFKEGLDNKNHALLKENKDDLLCSLHIRRGDYLKDPDFIGICDKDYYVRAINYVKNKFRVKRIVFLVFSNDMKWCKNNLSDSFGDSKTVYVDWNTGNNSYKDMQLMSLCNINIIANSSFSWWGAFLNQVENHMVITPTKYKNKDLGFNIYLDDWIAV